MSLLLGCIGVAFLPLPRFGRRLPKSVLTAAEADRDAALGRVRGVEDLGELA